MRFQSTRERGGKGEIWKSKTSIDLSERERERGTTRGYIYSLNLAVVHQVSATNITLCRKMLSSIKCVLNAAVGKSVAEHPGQAHFLSDINCFYL